MTESKKISVVILGSEGMLGRILLSRFKDQGLYHVFGTSRRKNSREYLLFRAEDIKKSLKNLLGKTKKIDYLINCVGIFDYKNFHDLIFINSQLPHFLEEFADGKKSKLIHISTDDVFPYNVGRVDESSEVGPSSLYGASKLLGETNSAKALTIRTSIIGFNPVKKRGLIESIKSGERKVKGYTNQLWTGSTVLQLADFCVELTKNGNFDKFRKKTPVLHFSPLGPITKYQIVKQLISLLERNKKVIKSRGKISKKRILESNFINLKKSKSYTNSIKIAIKELIEYEKGIK